MRNKYQNIEDKNVAETVEDLVEITNDQNEPNELNEPSIKCGYKAVVFGCTQLRIRRNPNEKAAIVGMLNDGDEVTVHGQTDGWIKIVSNDGLIGYCMSKFTKRK